jgi:hypothetical protein
MSYTMKVVVPFMLDKPDKATHDYFSDCEHIDAIH